MRKTYCLLLIVLGLVLTINASAQKVGGVSIGKGETPAQEKAILELVSVEKGLLIPRMSTVQRENIFNSSDMDSKGLLVYDLDESAIYSWNGLNWIKLGESASSNPLNEENPNDPDGDPTTDDGIAGEIGEVKYNANTESLWYFDGTIWVELGESSTGDALDTNNPNDPDGDPTTNDAISGITGQVKYNSTTESLWYYDGTVWVELGESSTGDALDTDNPNDPDGDPTTNDGVAGEIGQVKYNSTTESLWYYDGTVWVELGESSTGDALDTDNPNDPDGDPATDDGVSGQTGQVKYNSTTESLWYYDGTVWVELGESSTGDALDTDNPNNPDGDPTTNDGVAGETGQVKYNANTESLWYFDGTVWVELGESSTGDALDTDNPNDPDGDPTTNDGVAGETGQVKYNTTTESMWYYSGTTWIEIAGKTPEDIPTKLSEFINDEGFINTEVDPDFNSSVAKNLIDAGSGQVITNSERTKLEGLENAAAQVQGNWTETVTTSKAYIHNKPNLVSVAKTGDYNDLSNRPDLSNVAQSGDAYTKAEADVLLLDKVGVELGKSLSTNDYTNAEKAIVADAEVKNNKDVANGYVGLDVNKKIDESYLPKMTVGNVFAVNDEVEQLALVAVTGDVAVRSDLNKTYMHNGGLVGDMSDWTEMKTPTGEVFSVNGKKGDVLIGITDIANLRTELDNALGNELDPVYSVSQASNITNSGSGVVISITERAKLAGLENAPAQIQSDWNVSDASHTAFIKNKPDLSAKANVADVYTKAETSAFLDEKVSKVDGKGLSVNDYTDAEKAKVLNAELQANKNVAGGYVGLDGNLKINESYLPKMTVGNVYAVDNEAQQLALSASTGDVAVRSDLNKTFMHNGGNVNTMTDWTEMKTPSGEVFSVNGKKGDVLIGITDISGLQAQLDGVLTSESDPVFDASIAKNLTDLGSAKVITDAERTKLENLENAQVQEQADWTEADAASLTYIRNKPADIDENKNDDVLKTDVFVGDVTGVYSATKVEKIQNVSISALAPTNGQVLKFNGRAWEAGTDVNTEITVEDLLTSTTTTNALSANQGRILEDKKANTADLHSVAISGNFIDLTVANDVIVAAYVNADVAGNGLGQATDGSIETNVDDTTIEINGDALRLKDDGITLAKMNTNASNANMILGTNASGTPEWQAASDMSTSMGENVTSSSGVITGIANDAALVAMDLDVADDAIAAVHVNADVAGNGLGQATDGSIETNVDDTTIEVNGDALRLKADGITTGLIADGEVKTNDIENDAVTSDKLAHDLTIANDLTVNGNFYNPSDKRLKRNIKTLTSVLDKLKQMRGVSFLYKDQKTYASGAKIGVIAQELKEVYPELVTMGTNGYYKVDYTQLSAIVLQAVKEQQEKIESLERRLEKLEKLLSK